MPRSSLSVSTGSRTRWLWRALTTTLAAALLAGAGLAAASPAAAKRISDPYLEASVGCSTGDDGAGVLQLSGLFEGYDFTWAVTGDGYSVGGTFVGTGTDAEIAIEGLAPGVYATSVAIEHFDPVLGEFTVESCAPDLGVAVTPLACSTDRNGEALLTLTGLASGIVAYDVQGPSFAVGGPLDEFGETEEIELVAMPPGNYFAYAEWIPFSGEEPPPAPVFDWVVFVIEPCQPAIVVEVTECTAPGGTGETLLKLSSLVAGIEYEVAVTDRGAPDGIPHGGLHTVTGDETGTAQLLVSGLPPGRDFTAWVDGVWEAEPWVEPPFIGGGGGFELLETVVLAASADFSLKACPAVPVKPAVLPATGSGSTGDLLLGSILLLGLGGAALFAARRRATDARDLS